MFSFGKPKHFGPIEVQGRPLRCIICSNSTFWAHEIQLGTPLFSFLEIDEWNRLAQCAVCERCGYVHMFIPPSTFQREEEQQSERQA